MFRRGVRTHSDSGETTAPCRSSLFTTASGNDHLLSNHAFSEGRRSRVSRLFARPILKGSKGSIVLKTRIFVSITILEAARARREILVRDLACNSPRQRVRSVAPT
jgi:hypothetical protein